MLRAEILVLLLSCMAWEAPARAQVPLRIFVRAPASKEASALPAAVLQNIVQSHLLKQAKGRWELLDSGNGLAELLAEVDKAGADVKTAPGSVPTADLQVDLGPLRCKAGKCELQALLIEPASGRMAAKVRGEGAKRNEALRDFNAKLVQALLAQEQELGRSIRLELKNAPPGVEMKISSALKRACAEVMRRRAEKGSVRLLLRCKLDPLELQTLLSEQAGSAVHGFMQPVPGQWIMKFE